jgi:hypothetical protein
MRIARKLSRQREMTGARRVPRATGAGGVERPSGGDVGVAAGHTLQIHLTAVFRMPPSVDERQGPNTGRARRVGFLASPLGYAVARQPTCRGFSTVGAK